MIGPEPEIPRIDVPYLAFLDDSNADFTRFPDYIKSAINPAAVWWVPTSVDLSDPLSVLRLYIFDLEWLILPETHTDADGYTLQRVLLHD